MAEDRIYATGRRKTSVARVWITPGSGNITINKQPIENYFRRGTLGLIVRQPLEHIGQLEKYDIFANVSGGGWSGQAGAVKMGIARCLVMANESNKKALREGAEWLMMGNDDIVYKTKDWDKKLDQHISKLSDDYWLLWPNDGINGGSHCAFPIVSKAWHDTLGYFVPEIFIFGYHDTYVYRVAQRAGRCKYVSDIHNNHQHANRNPAERDATHTQAHRKAGTRQQVFAKDGHTIQRYQSHIEREGDIIKEKIAELSAEK